jgi:hypothetical protein
LGHRTSTLCVSPVSYELRQLWRLRFDRRVPAQFVPLSIKILRHYLPSNLRRNQQVAATSDLGTLAAIHDANSV